MRVTPWSVYNYVQQCLSLIGSLLSNSSQQCPDMVRRYGSPGWLLNWCHCVTTALSIIDIDFKFSDLRIISPNCTCEQ